MEHFKSLMEDKEVTREEQEKSIEQTARIQASFAGSGGERGLKDIDDITGYNYNTFDKDPHKSSYNAGMRAVSVILHHIIERDVKEARKQMIERKENAKT